jgi:hypothetical protein
MSAISFSSGHYATLSSMRDILAMWAADPPSRQGLERFARLPFPREVAAKAGEGY